jgi:hypothetical protein
VFLLQPVSKPGAFIKTSALAAIGFTLECVLQRKGWSYHMHPLRLWTGIAVFLFVTDFLRRRVPDRQLRAWASPAIVAVVTLAALASLAAVPGMLRRERDAVRDLLASAGPGRRVLPLSTDLWTSYPLVFEAGARNLLSWPAIWQLPGISREWYLRGRPQHLAQMSPDERAMVEEVAGLIALRPDFVFLNPRSEYQGMAERFDMIGYLSTHPRFRDEIAHYEAGPANNDCLVMVRQPSRYEP